MSNLTGPLSPHSFLIVLGTPFVTLVGPLHGPLLPSLFLLFFLLLVGGPSEKKVEDIACIEAARCTSIGLFFFFFLFFFPLGVGFFLLVEQEIAE